VPTDGLGGAVMEGFREAHGRWAVVMDGDLQHPPEMLPGLIDTALVGERAGGDDAVNIVAGSRFVEGGSAEGLSDGVRVFFSHFGNGIAKLLFPRKLAKSTDPMSGFFAVRLDAIDLTLLKPRGFKILLEILCRKQMNLAEVPATLAPRGGGESKADIKQVGRLARQIVSLRVGRLPGFAVIGLCGGIANLVIMAVLQHYGMQYIWAAVIAGAVTILGNFVAQELTLYHDLRAGAGKLWWRFAHSAGFNAVETAVRTFVLFLIVHFLHVNNDHAVFIQALLLVIGFLLRYTYHERVVYRQLTGEEQEAQTTVS
jgi:dolichol-phosphate mannosyltransferase